MLLLLVFQLQSKCGVKLTTGQSLREGTPPHVLFVDNFALWASHMLLRIVLHVTAQVTAQVTVTSKQFYMVNPHVTACYCVFKKRICYTCSFLKNAVTCSNM